MSFKFRLYLTNGEDVGTFATAVPDWRIGDEFRCGDGNCYRIEDIVSDEDLPADAFHGLFVVTPIDLAAL